MQGVQTKTLQDLEFPTVLQQLAARCTTEKGKAAALTVVPIADKDHLLATLGKTSEYVASFTNENRIPNHGFDAVDKELQLLAIENTVLEVPSFRKIAHLCTTISLHKKFFKKFKEYYPLLFAGIDQIEENTFIPNAINDVVDRFGEIKDNASVELKRIRMDMNVVRGKINSSFGTALSRYQGMDYLDEIKESIVENRRVLAVKAMYRRKVRGTVMGNSKTGSIVYIVPEATLQYSTELSNLEYEEKEEIRRILLVLTNTIRPEAVLIKTYQYFLTEIDLTAAKAKYANEMNGILPIINEERTLYLRDAYHPLLYLNNKNKQEKTWPQTISLSQDNRIIVISGPNAGGKSITLKTIGLLQLMLQSGFMVPVHERSSMCLFDKVLTDIGDNQSIENHLSTYSYRLKNMNQFLKRCNSQTLFLIDEFGTGSDPELGGALAESFLEVFYEREAFGVITTHYANLKLLANELPHMTNANMQFDNKTLEPTFKLIMGEAGSSFTFEVAQKNGIPYSLINKAKKKIDRGKVRFDATISKLQKERSKMSKTESRLQDKEAKAKEEAERLEKLNAKIKNKLENYQELYDHNQRMIYLGNKLNDAAERYFHDKKKRALISEMLRIVETENSKRKKATAKEAKAKKAIKKQTAKELEQKIVKVREEKKELKAKAVKQEKAKPKAILKLGDRVRMQDGKAVGTIDTLEKGKAVVNYGLFTTNVSVDQLELVERKK
ncbi:DNA mismatch repair protein MutS [Flavobacterium sp. ASW18X]|uniref:endonuclease MutS2 n=1 Tax=Flavobacterium sp. ASW18X TaxID=2572595 RepID=UPI0010AEB5DA|nr:DNA mismatch repair protein MutS [Flavobacterium sp. ASW18X]TKD65992.1 DNA mismatch repair protein MutS [Flavobacterium sp. ASW18X]